MTGEQQRTPDEPTVYHHTLTEQMADEQITDAQFAADMAELERLGYVKRVAGETVVYPANIAGWLASDRPVRHVPIDARAAGFRKGIEDRLLDAVAQLGTATVAYGEALDRHAAATVRAFESQATLDYAELDFRAKCYGEGVPGKNEAERKVNVDLAVMDDEALSELRVDAELRRHTRTEHEAMVRKLDVSQKSLRAQVAALTALLRSEH